MRIRQIVFAAQSLQQGRDAVAALFQLPPPFRDPGVAEFGVDNAVFVFGDQFIEVISPCRADTACGRHLARHGDSGYMLLLQTDDLARERQRFVALRVRSIWNGEHPDIVAMHLHPKDVGGAIVSVDQPRPASSRRWGGPAWVVQPGPAGEQRIRGITLQSPDPHALAKRWAEVFNLPVPVANAAGWRVALTDGFADFKPVVSKPVGADFSGEGVAGFTLAVVEPGAMLERARLAGLQVDGPLVTVMGAGLTIEAL